MPNLGAPPATLLRDAAAGALLFAATLLAYWPALCGGLLWDDSAHVTRPDLRSLDGLRRIWFELGATQQYYPLLHSAFWVEHRLWGDAVLGYHLANIVLHATAALLVVLIVRRLALPWPWLAGFVFALHPVCVNSVAWISEQKSTLSAVFYLASALVYLRFDRTRRPAHYLLATLLFLLALLSKTVTATLPAALLVVFWWQRGRLHWKRDLQPLLAWLAIGAAAGLFTAWIERSFIGAQGPDFALTLIQRCLLAGRAIVFYLSTLLWPANLVFIYPHWTLDPAVWWQYLFPLAVLALAAALCLVARRRRGPLAAFLFFAGTLFPVLGFLNVYPFVYSYVADHFQYLASLGVIVPLVSGLAIAARKIPTRSVVPALSAAMVALLAALTWRQSSLYRDSETIYQHTLAHNPSSWMAHNNLASDLLNQPARLPDAMSHLQIALQLKPDSAEAHNNLGNALMNFPGRLPEAIANYESALRIRPRFPEAENNLGRALAKIPGRSQEALDHFESALRLRPQYADAHANLGAALLDMPGRSKDAIAEFEAALRINPDLAEAHNGLGSAFAQTAARAPEAIAQFETALQLRPDYAEAHLNLGSALSDIPARLPDALREFDAALKIRPDYAEAHNGRGVALSRMGRTPEALAEFDAALKIRPDYAEAHNNLGSLLAQAGRLAEAVPHLEVALRGNPDSAEMHANLGSALAEIPGRLPDAIRHFEAAVRIRPDFAEAHYLLGAALVKIPGRLHDAQAQFEEAQRLKPELRPMIDRLRSARSPR